MLYISLKHLKLLIVVIFERWDSVYVQSGESFPFMTQSLLLKIKDVHINRVRVKHDVCFVTSRDNNTALEHITIHFV